MDSKDKKNKPKTDKSSDIINSWNTMDAKRALDLCIKVGARICDHTLHLWGGVKICDGFFYELITYISNSPQTMVLTLTPQSTVSPC